MSERLFVPVSRLRGFEKAKVGPKDGKDFIGGNYVASLNFQYFTSSSSKFTGVDISFFMDAANIWGVDYDSSIDDSNKIRSSAGIGIDWMTPIGPVNFIFAEAITKSDTDVEETFRFNIGTSF